MGKPVPPAGEGGGGLLAEDAGFQDVALERGEARVAAELLEGGLVGDEAELRVEPFVEGPVVRGIGRAPVDGDGDFKTIFSMLKDVVTGRYTEAPWGTVAALAGMLLYVLTPIDLVPDAIPFLGFGDDVAMLALALKLCKGDIAKYRAWKAAHP